MGADGLWHKKNCGSEKSAAQQIANKLSTEAKLRLSGIIDASMDRFSAAERRPLADHLSEFKADILARGGTALHAETTGHRCTAAIEAAGIERIGELTPRAVNAAISKLESQGGLSAASVAHYRRAIKMFSRWLWRNGRVGEDALASLTVKTTIQQSERIIRRRGLSREEFTALITHTKAGPVRWNLSGVDRSMLYALAGGSGLRAAELRSLTAKSFRLEDKPPCVVLKAAYSKRRRDDVQPLSASLTTELKFWLVGKPVDAVLFPVARTHTGAMFRSDLRYARALHYKAMAAGQERRELRKGDFLRTVDTDGRKLDFHALRHSYVSWLVQSGASIKTCQELARHSTPMLTLGTYAHMSLHDANRAIESLPSPMESPVSESKRQVLLPTGTDNLSTELHAGELGGKTGGKTVPFRAAACHQGLMGNSKAAPQGKPRLVRESVDFVADAGGGNRTHTLLRELDFESSASASSATPAIQWDELYAKNHAMKSDRQAADRQAADRQADPGQRACDSFCGATAIGLMGSAAAVMLELFFKEQCSAGLNCSLGRL